jgi:hypothetical protein
VVSFFKVTTDDRDGIFLSLLIIMTPTRLRRRERPAASVPRTPGSYIAADKAEAAANPFKGKQYANSTMEKLTAVHNLWKR